MNDDLKKSANVLPYAGPGIRPQSHSLFGKLSVLWPVLLIAYLSGLFGRPLGGRANSVVILVAIYLVPLIALAAMIEAIVRKRNFALPLLSLLVSLATMIIVLHLLMSA